MEAKALINFKEGTVELFGSETFISHYLDKFKDSLTSVSKKSIQQQAEVELDIKPVQAPKAEPPVAVKPAEEPQPVKRGRGRQKKVVAVAAPPKAKEKTAAVVEAPKKTRKKGEKLHPFNMTAENNIPALLDFLYSKNALDGTTKFMTAIAYYIIKIRGASHFTLGNIEYAYSVLPMKNKPTYMSSALQNIKKNNGYITLVGKGKWELTKAGETYVNMLPKDIVRKRG